MKSKQAALRLLIMPRHTSREDLDVAADAIANGAPAHVFDTRRYSRNLMAALSVDAPTILVGVDGGMSIALAKRNRLKWIP
jgi:hypothetical protein